MRKLYNKISTTWYVISCIVLSFQISAQDNNTSWFEWKELNNIPDSLGLGGIITGKLDGQVVVAGGSNFLLPPWENGIKLFHDQVYMLDDRGADAQWELVGQLPFPISNGASVTLESGILVMGGVNKNGTSDKVFLMSWDPLEGKLKFDLDLPPLPQKAMYLSATAIGNQIYVAGGRNDENPWGLENFWRLDLDLRNTSDFKWETLPSWPGEARFGSVLAAQNNGLHDCVYLISGKNGDGTYFKDCFEFDPSNGDGAAWHRKSDLPRAAMVAPATIIGQTHIAIFSGSDGHDVDKINRIKDDYSFVRDILAYHTITDTWISVGEMPQGIVASGVIETDAGWILPGGEIRPGRRTNKTYRITADAIAQKSFFHWIDFLVLGLYLLFISLLGVFFSREKKKDTKNYFLGGAKIPFWAAALSIMATSISSIGFMATPSKSFATDWAYFAGTLTMFLVIPIVVFAFIPFYHKLKVVSAYEYLEARFNVVIRLFAAITYCIFQIAGRMAIVLYLPGIALAAVTGLDIYMAILLMGLISTFYTVLGGMKAVIWTDVIQGFVLVGGALLCVVVAVFSMDGKFGPYLVDAFEQNKMYIGNIHDWDYATASLWVVVFGNVFYRLSTFTSDQSVVQRYMVTANVQKAQKASWTSLGLLVPWAIIVFALGTVLFIFYRAHPDQLNPLVNTDGILPLFIAQKMPVGVSGLIIAAIFAAAMSSLDSAMHSTATVLVTDFYKRFKPATSEAAQLKLAKWLIAIFGVFGTAISMLMVSQNFISIWDVFLEFTGLFGGIVAGLFFPGDFLPKGAMHPVQR